MNGKRIIVAAIVVIFVIMTSVFIFTRDWGGSDVPTTDAVQSVSIADYANTNVKVRMTARGEINSNQEHQDFQITVGQSETLGEILEGYQGTVERSVQIANNPESYRAFLSALSNANFTARKLPPPGVQYDGACATGVRYTFEFLGGDERTPKSTWTTSCKKAIGTFAGDLSEVRRLFEAQLPADQLDTLTEDTEF